MYYLLTALFFYIAGILTFIIPEIYAEKRKTKKESGFEHYKRPQTEKKTIFGRWFR